MLETVWTISSNKLILLVGISYITFGRDRRSNYAQLSMSNNTKYLLSSLNTLSIMCKKVGPLKVKLSFQEKCHWQRRYTPSSLKKVFIISMIYSHLVFHRGSAGAESGRYKQSHKLNKIKRAAMETVRQFVRNNRYFTQRTAYSDIQSIWLALYFRVATDINQHTHRPLP